MKKNDPANLRIPAVNLLTELIPDGDMAGVWTFGQWVNNLIRHQKVDDKWRRYAKQEADKINSVALYTNIGAVLEKASEDFSADRRFDNTHFILLTDGMVDIDQDPEKNSTERERILTQVANRIRDKGAHLHTVALSRNADWPLMEKLAVFTGGQAATAETPEDLTRIFLQALDQAVPSEQVPLEGNVFNIDSSIEEFTALIFRGQSGSPTVLRGPDLQSHTVSAHADGVKWYQQAGYDLITVERPLEGAWEIQTDVGPGSRVTVVSNLQLQVNRLPVNFFAGQHLPVEVSFAESGLPITNPDFLALMEVDLVVKTVDGKQGRKTISDPAKVPTDGVFRDAITKLSDVGQYEISVLVDGKTFKRQHRQVVNLKAPFDFEFSVKGQGGDAHYVLVVTALTESIDVAATKVFARVKAPDESSLIKAVEQEVGGRRWQLPIKPEKGDGQYQVGVKVRAVDAQKREFEFSPKAFDADYPIPAGAATQIVSNNEPEAVAEPEPEPEAESVAEVSESSESVLPEEVEVMPVESSDDSDWTLWAAIAGGVLSLLALVGGGLYLKGRKQDSVAEAPEEVLSDDVVKEIMEEPIPVVSPPLLDESIADELDFVEEPDVSIAAKPPTLESSVADDDIDLSMDMPDFDEPDAPAADEELLAADLAEAIEDAADEVPDGLQDDEEAALDLEQVLAEEDDDDDDEFNLEDFDIGETDDLPDPKKT
jgi:uncharacterized protein (TIGR03503 family)